VVVLDVRVKHKKKTVLKYAIHVESRGAEAGVRVYGFARVFCNRKVVDKIIVVKAGGLFRARRARALAARARMFVTSRVLFQPTQQYEI
jgi:hypothetical protein